MTLGEAAYRIVTGTRSLRTEGTTHRAWLAELGQGKSQRALATELNVPRRTLRDWLAGTHQPNPGHMDGLKRAVRRKRLAASRETRLRGPRGQRALKIKGRIRVSKDKRPRTINVGAHLSDNPPSSPFVPDIQWTFGPLIDKYLSGGDERMLAEELDRAVKKYEPGMEVLDVEWIRA